MLVFISCLVSVLLFRLSDDVDADHPDIYLFFTPFSFSKFLSNLPAKTAWPPSLSFPAIVSLFFFPAWQETSAPQWFLHSDWEMRGNGSLSASEIDEGEKSLNFSDPETENISVGCRQITTNERMYCFMLKLCCSHAKKSRTQIVVSRNWAEKIVKGGRVLCFYWIHIHPLVTSRLQPGQANVGWQSVVFLTRVDHVWPSSGQYMASR